MIRFEEVINGCLKNDIKCKEIVYKSFYGYLMAIVLRYVKDRHDSEELVNDVFIKIFKSLAQFNFPSGKEATDQPFKAWIAKIASRTAIDFLRTKRVFLSIDEIVEDHEPLIEINVVSELHVKDILKLIESLPEMQRVIFNLFEIEGFSHQEIAKLLTIPESSSRVYLTRAKQKLRVSYAKTLIYSNAIN